MTKPLSMSTVGGGSTLRGCLQGEGDEGLSSQSPNVACSCDSMFLDRQCANLAWE